ncbi:hypothetical protein GCM10009080_20710 [Cupriavidus pauculus]
MLFNETRLRGGECATGAWNSVAELRDTERWDSLGKVVAAPAPQPEAIYARNLEKYGDKLGPTVDWLRAKGKNWEEIIESVSRSGGKDLGF